jgi:phosphotransferase system enzyme I (PtsI)
MDKLVDAATHAPRGILHRGTVSDSQLMRGSAVSSGVARGKAYVLASAEGAVVPRRRVEEAAIEGELARFEAALHTAERDLLALKKDVADRIGVDEADIFAAQALVVRDHALHGQVVALVRHDRINIEAALADVIEKFTRTFDQIPDAYLRERAADIRDVGRRVLAALIEDGGAKGLEVPEGSILVADELSPSATARLELNRVRAFVTDRGGKFSHTSILARSMRMPAVTGVSNAALAIKTGDRLIVDGISGVVFVNPDEGVEHEYDRLIKELRSHNVELQKVIDLPSITLDGTTIPLLANVSKLSDTEAACLYNADGIGLYRTEFSFSLRDAFPTEEDQFEVLKRAAERVHPRKVVLRLLDVGGDKQLAYFPLPGSRNPSLASRGIRLLLANPEILRRQLRAFLRVSAEHPVSILLPVVGGLEEVRATRAVVERVQAELRADGRPFNPETPIGAMIEVPSAALLAAELAREVDFFSLGTNDLVQYVLAADREDDAVAAYYRPLHPAVLRLIHAVAQAAAKATCPLTICGEMAGDPRYTELLIGLGLRELSVAPGEMLEVKRAIRGTTTASARALAVEALESRSVTEVEAALDRRLQGKV